MASLEDIRVLQAQVDSLKSRLDYVAPKFSSLQLSLQTAARVESEAMLQLMRLRSEKGALSCMQNLRDEDLSLSVDLATWLQVVTDVVLSLLSRSDFAEPPAKGSEPFGYRQASTRQNGHRALEHSKSPASVRERSKSPASYMFSPKKALNPESFSPRSGNIPQRPEFRTAAHQPQGQLTRSPRSQKREAKRIIEINAAQDDSRGPVIASIDTTLDRNGLALGKGAWANAYREATGARRDALRMLGMTGIVTERELTDDLTEIGQDHIDECILIATEMLQKWPAHLGQPPIQEAKSFFEHRLAELYMSRMAPPEMYEKSWCD